ncbi:MAG TPA: FUSC family protein [Pseudolysinimonas sp.]|jgi:hypothetical protein
MPHRIRRSLAEATATILALVATVATSWLLTPSIGTAVLGAMLCLSLSRSQLERDWRGRMEAFVALPVIGLLAAGVGALLLNERIIGAAVYVVAMFLSVYLRRFGPVPRRIGSLLALPFIALLVAPSPVPPGASGPGNVLVPALVALIAFGWVTIFQALGMLLRALPRPRAEAAETASGPAFRRPPRRAEGAPRVDPTTRLALQMALSLALAFAIGFLFFAERWAWVVLTVVVVAVGNTGRADVLYKGIQRLVGAAVGTVLALLALLLPTAAFGAPSPATLLLLLVVLFVAVFARPFGYLWWALLFTLALAVLQGFTPSADGGGSGGFLLGERLEEILLGSVLALAVAWFLLPVRSENTVRRRLAELLAAFQERLAAQTPETAGQLADAEKSLKKVSAPYDTWRRIRRGARRPRAGLWIATARDSVDLGREGGGPAARKALGDARRALREPDTLQPALEKLRTALAGKPE